MPVLSSGLPLRQEHGAGVRGASRSQWALKGPVTSPTRTPAGDTGLIALSRINKDYK